MKDKRRSERSPFCLTLNISDIFAKNHSSIDNLQTPIELVNISVNGLGFVTDCVLPLDHYFKARFTLSPEQPEIETVVKIIRVDVQSTDTYLYGCEFVMLNEADRKLIEDFTALQP